MFERKCGANLILFFNGTEMSWCRTVFFNGCRNVLVPNFLDARDIVQRRRTIFFHSTKNLDFYNLFTLSHGDLYIKTLLLCLLSDLYPFTHKSSSGKHKYSRKLLVTLWPFSRAGTFSGLHVHILS